MEVALLCARLGEYLAIIDDCDLTPWQHSDGVRVPVGDFERITYILSSTCTSYE